MNQSTKEKEEEVGTYVPASDVAKTYGYTTDHVTRLIRSRKVKAKKVGRRWFVETESFKLEVSQIQEVKEERLRKLSQQRKQELSKIKPNKTVTKKGLTNNGHAKLKNAPVSIPSCRSTLYQTIAVVFCGLLVGVLAFAFTETYLFIKS